MQPIITVKQLVKIYKDFNELWKTLQTDKAKFDEITLLYCAIINKCEMDRIPYYVDEYYTKVAAIYDAVDTLEFGKLRTETQKAMHKNYLSVTMRGAFLATAYDGEKDIALSYCSHEGLKVHIKNKIAFMEQNKDTIDADQYRSDTVQIDAIIRDISIVHVNANKLRIDLIASSKDALASALQTSKRRYFCLIVGEYYMDVHAGGVRNGFKCEYYKKPNGKVWPKTNYKILLYDVLQSAHDNNRDLYSELRELIITPPSDFSHDNLLEVYRAERVQEEADRLKAEELRAVNLQKKKLNAERNKKILEEKRVADEAITDPDLIEERELEKRQLHKLVTKLVSGVKQPGDSSDEDEEEEEEVEKHEEEKEIDMHYNVEVRETMTTVEVMTEPQQEQTSDSQRSSIFSSQTDNIFRLPVVENTSSFKAKKSEEEQTNKSSRHRSTSSSSKIPREETRISSRGDNDYHQSSSAECVLMKAAKRKYDPKYKPKADDSSSADSELDDDGKDVQKSSPEKHNKSHHRHKVDKHKHSKHKKRHHERSSSTHNHSKRVSMFIGGIDNQSNLVTSPSSVRDQAFNEAGLVESVVELSLLEQRQQIKDNKRETVKNSSSQSSSRVQKKDYDSSFPSFDGHPAEDSLLHDIDDSLTYFNDKQQSGEEEMDFDDSQDDNENVGWKKNKSDSSTTHKKRRKRSSRNKEVDPIKEASKLAAEREREVKKMEREREAKKTRDEQTFQRRVLEVNAGRNDDSGEGDSRKKRMTSGLSASWENFYGDNLSINQCSRTDRKLITGCAVSVLGEVTGLSVDDDEADFDVISMVSSYRQQSGYAADVLFREKLMKHLQMDIFKEITFERLIAEYAIAKREACGANDDEIVDIDWCEVMHEFRVVLKARLTANSNAILERIHAMIDLDKKIISKTSSKQTFTDSMTYFIKHGVRTINSVVNKTIHKLASHFDSINFSGELPKFATYANKTKGYAFAFTASLYNMFGSDQAEIADAGDEFGIDPLLREIMKTTIQEKHMSDIIQYKLVSKSMYIETPENYGALHKYLEKKKNSASAKKSVVAILDATEERIEEVNSHTVPVDVEIEEEGTSSNNTVSHHTLGCESSSTPSTVVNKQLFPTTIDKSSDKSRQKKVEEIIVIDEADQSTATPVILSVLAQTTQCYRQLLELLLSDVKGQTESLFLKFNAKHNVRNVRNLQLIKFVETFHYLDEDAMFDMFCESSYFKSLSTTMFIPFKQADQFSIKGDGYCFYRAIFMLWLRFKSGYQLSSEALSEIDNKLKSVGSSSNNDLRTQFQDFFNKIEILFPDPNARSKVATAKYTFIHLKTYLDERFWGGSDSVPFLDYPCTAFSHNKSETSLPGCWAKMYCSSLPGLLNGRETVNADTVGVAYNLNDIQTVLMNEHNWLLHKKVHFFVADHPSVEEFSTSFKECVIMMLREIRERLLAMKGSDSDWTFAEIYDRIVDGKSEAHDSILLINAKNSLVAKLNTSNVILEEDRDEAVSQQSFHKRDIYIPATLQGASPAEKQYILELNDEVAVRELENELLRAQLDGLKDMIARNSAAANEPVFIDFDE